MSGSRLGRDAGRTGARSVKISKIHELLDASYLTGEAFGDRIVWSADGGELMDDVLNSSAKDCVLLTGLTTLEVVTRCVAAGVGCVVFVRGKDVAQHIVDAAEKHQLPLLSTSYPLLVACGHLYMNGLRGFDESW